MVQAISLDRPPRSNVAATAAGLDGMEVRISNFPENLDFHALKDFLRPHLNRLQIRAVWFAKSYNRKHASLTFLHSYEGEKFLSHHGQVRTRFSTRPVPINGALYSTLKFHARPVYFEKSQHNANPITVRTLHREQAQRDIVTTRHLGNPPLSSNLPISFTTTSVSCGLFDYIGSDLVFSPQITWKSISSSSVAKFGTRSMILQLNNGFRIDFRYSAILGIITETYPIPSFTISMHEAPRFYQKISSDPATELIAALNSMTIQSKMPPNLRQRSGPTRTRVPGVDPWHEKVAGHCLVYRFQLRNARAITRQDMQEDVGELMEHLKTAHEVPTTIYQPISVVSPSFVFSETFDTLMDRLSSSSLDFPIPLKFQVQRLAQNNYLHPAKVLLLLPEVENMLKRNINNVSVCIAAVRKLCTQISFAGPETDASDFRFAELVSLLKSNEAQFQKEGVPVDMASKSNSNNVAIIHRARVTPTGIYLQGPAPESKNRVLRRYPEHHEYFIRVQFCDEDGGPVLFSPRVNNYKIYHSRFKDVLDKGLNIAGMQYSFLGFSHSSLRAQSCWFVAPFVFDSQLILDRMIISDLGDFSMIHAPAKCAARIGQAFSDTPTALHIDPENVFHLPEVKFGARVFSDGVGTISKSMLFKVWDKLPAGKSIKPTCFQIRYRGAKGMVSYDSRLEGDALMLRDSMIKFEGSTSNDLEICDSAYKPLPMYLNRQLIKILEDLGVEDSFFLGLQATQIKKLRMTTESPINASSFLKRQSIGEQIHLPWLINRLAMMNLNFKDDGFLRDVVEVAILVELRMLKHKTRILVENGWHLHGLMDETGFLKEGEIFCSVIVDGVMKILTGNDMIISRAPALHPGDVQLANAVMPPANSPLLRITNCICFSQKGVRDLPSQLSGGDLDGDRYYIMFDQKAQLKRTVVAADYPIQPPVTIDGQVNKSHMTDFFLQFMENDQLGRIAVAHRVLADQKKEGTLDPDCVKLAEKHSTAVDYSKSGIVVDVSDMPKMNRARPDFEAPGPHIHIEKLKGIISEERVFVDPDDQNDEDDDFTSYRYYESEKVLGKLYRAIDERKIFGQIQARATGSVASHSTVIRAAWNIIQNECRLIQWKHWKDWAWDIRRAYEGCLSNNMIDFSRHPNRPLSELEAFVGNILGQSGVPTRRERDDANTMKEKFEEDSLYIVNLILKDGDEWHRESLERSMACLAVSLEDSPTRAHRGEEHILSFKYVAAAICLREVEMLPLPSY